MTFEGQDSYLWPFSIHNAFNLTMKKSLLSALLYFIPFFLAAQTQPVNTHPKREFRGVWIATVENIDWPSSQGLSAEAQKRELISILDEHQKNGINAIMLQVRPAADALYAKSREPWSKFLTGKQGRAPSPCYDPLEFAIHEAHKRSMELHAWFNPYRASVHSDLSPDHITRIRPEWFFTFAGKKLFNPGLPEVREYIIGVIMDVVRNYDIDGVHFDDYFYPYPAKGQQIEDIAAYKRYGGQFSNIADWRRHNVDTLIRNLSDSIQHAKSHVKFGISPFGIWRNRSTTPEGSESTGLQGYETLYADARKWMKEGWLDYINPQIYFPFYYRAAPYEKLVDWWSDNAFGKHVYVGHGVYRANERRPGWSDRRQLPDQIRYLRANNRVQGSVFFSSKSVTRNMAGFQDSLRNDFYKHPALPPQMIWKKHVTPLAPTGLRALRIGHRRVSLTWNAPLMERDGQPAYGYVVYRFKASEAIDIQKAENIISINYNNTTAFIDENTGTNTYFYVVTALDRLKNESPGSNKAMISID